MTESVNVGGPFGDDRANGPSWFAAHNLVATFDGPRDARAALVHLERKGIGAGDIELSGPGVTVAHAPLVNDEQRGIDMAVLQAFEKRGVTGILLGGAAGAVIGGVIAAIVSGGASPIVGSAVAGALLVGALGFLWGGFSGMSVNEQWGETFDSDGGETSLVVHSDDPTKVDLALRTLRSLRTNKASRLATCGPDGHLHDAA